MAEPVLSRVAEARSFLSKLWKLAAPYWWAEGTGEIGAGPLRLKLAERWIARGLLVVILFLSVFSVYISKLFNDWYGRFYNALQDKDAAAFWVEIRWFSVLAFVYIVVAVYRIWLRQYLEIRWRRWLTGVYIRSWLGGNTYYRMELTAPIEALASLNQRCAVTIYTDSQYLRNGINTWIHGWKGRGWKTADHKPVKNVDLWQRLDALVATGGHQIEWRWVKGHAGDPGNERADALANMGVEKALGRR